MMMRFGCSQMQNALNMNMLMERKWRGMYRITTTTKILFDLYNTFDTDDLYIH